MQITPELDKQIDAVIAQYPVKKSAAMVSMHIIQEAFGYFDDAAVRYVASKLEVEPIEIYGMLSFYPMFTEKPRGRVHIKVCRTLSCALAGSIKTMSEISKRINCPVGGTSADGVYTLEFVECLGNCVKAPNIQVNDKLFDGVAPDKVEKFLENVAKYDAEGKLAARSSSEKPAGTDLNSPEYKG